jgi:hypothetical protein
MYERSGSNGSFYFFRSASKRSSKNKMLFKNLETVPLLYHAEQCISSSSRVIKRQIKPYLKLVSLAL